MVVLEDLLAQHGFEQDSLPIPLSLEHAAQQVSFDRTLMP